jgi:RNA-binding protein
MALNEKQKKHLRRLAHPLEPVLLTGGAGLTPGLLAELDSTLDHHELLKVRVRAGDRDSRDAMIRALCDKSGAELVQRIGHVAVLWRPNPERRKITLPA